MSFQTLIHDEVVSIIATLTKVSKSLIAALLPVLKSDLSALLTELLPIAEQVVVGLATGTQSGKEKQAAAFSSITSAAENAGIQATAQAVNIAIELAVANLKPVAATAPAPVEPVAAPVETISASTSVPHTASETPAA